MKDETDNFTKDMHASAITTQARLALDMLAPSKTNPRSRRGFDEVSLNNLAASIKSADVLQPILVRPLAAQPAIRPDVQWPFPTPGIGKTSTSSQYEIVAGERRWRAARIAGLTDVPVVIRELTDLEVLRIQLIENVQRKDLDALEEAEGYEKLMQQKDADGNPYTAELIGDLMGVSKATVYARLKLTALCQDARDAFFEGKLDASTALLIARIPIEKLQLQALKKITEVAGYGNQFMATGDKMSYRLAREILQSEFMLALDRAPFDTKDAALLPKAGNCTACPKRTGNAPDLFDDVKSKDVCTDTVCFGMKKAAHVLKLQKDAEDQGSEVITGKAAKKLLPNNWSDPSSQLKEHGYATLDTFVPGDAKKRTLGQVLKESKLLVPDKATGKPAVQKTVVANPHREGQMIETVNIEQATKALREAGFEITLKGREPSGQNNAAAEKENAKIKQAVERETAYRERLHTTLRASIAASTAPGQSAKPGLYALLAELALEQFYDNSDTEELVKLMRLYQPDIVVEAEKEYEAWNDFMKQVPSFTPQQHFMLLFDVLMLDETCVSEWAVKNKKEPPTMTRIAEIEGIAPAKLRAEIAAEEKAEEVEKKPAAKTASTPTKAAPAADKHAGIRPWPFPTQHHEPAKETAKKAKTKAAVAA